MARVETTPMQSVKIYKGKKKEISAIMSRVPASHKALHSLVGKHSKQGKSIEVRGPQNVSNNIAGGP